MLQAAGVDRCDHLVHWVDGGLTDSTMPRLCRAIHTVFKAADMPAERGKESAVHTVEWDLSVDPTNAARDETLHPASTRRRR